MIKLVFNFLKTVVKAVLLYLFIILSVSFLLALITFLGLGYFHINISLADGTVFYATLLLLVRTFTISLEAI